MDFCYLAPRKCGLGNCLLPWARGLLFSRAAGLPIVAPWWGTLRIRRWLRGQWDDRIYARFFDFRGYVRGQRRLALMAAGSRIECDPMAGVEELMEMYRGLPEPGARPRLLVFTAIGDYFRPLRGHHEELRRELLRITRPRYLPRREDLPRRFFAIHVRRGDFIPPRPRRGLGGANVRLPLDHYTGLLDRVRRRLGWDREAVVFSDGDPGELAPLLERPGVSLRPRAAAVTDLIAMSWADMLLASSSTFSSWATFLGQVPSIYHPRFYPVAVQPDLAASDVATGGDAVIEATPESPLPDSFLDAVERRATGI